MLGVLESDRGESPARCFAAIAEVHHWWPNDRFWQKAVVIYRSLTERCAAATVLRLRREMKRSVIRSADRRPYKADSRIRRLRTVSAKLPAWHTRQSRQHSPKQGHRYSGASVERVADPYALRRRQRPYRYPPGRLLARRTRCSAPLIYSAPLPEPTASTTSVPLARGGGSAP